MNDTFGDYAEVYSALYSEKSYPEEAHYLADLFESNGVPKGSSLIEFGAGNGQLSLELGRLGYLVKATDLSSEMASRSISGANVEVGDIRNFSSSKTFDGALAFFHVLSYLRSDEDLRQAFENISRLLSPGGVFVADFWYGPAVRYLKPEIRVKQVKTDEVEVFRVAEPEWNQKQNLVDVIYTGFFRTLHDADYKKFSETHSMRYFDAKELEEFSATGGLELVRLEETMTGKLPSDTSWGVTAVFWKSRGGALNGPHP